MSGKSQRDLVLTEEIHTVLHGHTIQQWTSLRYIININLKGFILSYSKRERSFKLSALFVKPFPSLPYV